MSPVGDRGEPLPQGPVFQSPDALIRAFGGGPKGSTNTNAKTAIFKAIALRGVRSLFPTQHNPFYAAFGADPSDREAFRSCEVPEGRIFIVNTAGELALSSSMRVTNFEGLVRDVEEVFPDLRGTRNTAGDDVFGSNFWRVPLPSLD